MIDFTKNEQTYLNRLRARLRGLRKALNTLDLDGSDETGWWFEILREMRAIQGNTSNDISFVACLLAKQFIIAHHSLQSFDAAEKAQGAPGLDIDILTTDGKRVIGEIKTTVPYSGATNDLGAAQKTSFQKDFDKLNNAVADYKYFFVTDKETFEIVERKYAQKIPGVDVVLLHSPKLRQNPGLENT